MSARQKYSAAVHPDPERGRLYNAAAEHEQNIVGTRLAQARQDRGLTLTAFSELLSRHGLAIQRTGISRWESGAAVPNAYQLLAVCHALNIPDGLSYFTGTSENPPELNEEGLRRLEEYRADLIATGKYRPQPRPAAAKIVYIEKPVSSLPASAGAGEFLEEGGFEMVRFPASTVPEQADFGIRVSGDSMEPVYQDGQIVWVQACSRLTPGEVGVFMYDGSGYIKVYGEQEPDRALRDSFLSSSGVLHMQPVLISYNEAYEPKPISPALPFSIVGRVLN